MVSKANRLRQLVFSLTKGNNRMNDMMTRNQMMDTIIIVDKVLIEGSLSSTSVRCTEIEICKGFGIISQIFHIGITNRLFLEQEDYVSFNVTCPVYLSLVKTY